MLVTALKAILKSAEVTVVFAATMRPNLGSPTTHPAPITALNAQLQDITPLSAQDPAVNAA